MCDTLVALTSEGNGVIFGKNSDRPSSEVQLITHKPRSTYSKGAELTCTYITIPQVKETASIILSQPWWMWGAEMGCNEYGVVIGNEAVHTFEPLRDKGLLGMDLLRLGLERGKTAQEALSVITELLERYHQGGGCAYNDPSWTYHNSFLIADPEDAWVLETADDWWVAEKVKDIRSISNGLTIRGKGDRRRQGIIQHAIEKGYCRDDDSFDFAVTFSGSAPSNSPYSRKGRTKRLLTENKGHITPRMMMEFLRDHQAGICMHGGFESTGSQVSSLRNERKNIHWFTGTTLPCKSVYKPYIFPVEGQHVEDSGPYNKKDKDWEWMRHSDYIKTSTKSDREEYEGERNTLEAKIYKKLEKILSEENNFTENELNNQLIKVHKEAYQKAHQLIV
jgi:secernin